MAHLQLVALLVRDYDEAIRFFVDVLQFEALSRRTLWTFRREFSPFKAATGD